jgi:4-hydroxy-tetrahydrodipicolinate reductase
MGRQICAEAPEHGFEVLACYDLSVASPSGPLPDGVGVLIDFSAPGAFDSLGRLLEGRGAALVSGTTGLGSREKSLLSEWSSTRAVFYSPNMSMGIHVLCRLVFEAARLLGDRVDLEIVETHHRGKIDSPSGTALKILESWAGGSGRSPSPVYGRSGRMGPREKGEAGVHSLRGGDVPGDHEVHLLGDGERILLAHRVSGRRTFVLGALAAARYVDGRAPGLYGMDDLAGPDGRDG